MNRHNDRDRPAAPPPPPPRSRLAGGPPPIHVPPPPPPPLPRGATQPDVVPMPETTDLTELVTPVVEKERRLAGLGPIIATAVVAVVVVLGTAIFAGRILLSRESPGDSSPDVQARGDDTEPAAADFAGREPPDSVAEGMNRAVGRDLPNQSRGPTALPQPDGTAEDSPSETSVQKRIPSRD
jgi:hypothetical protein